MFESIEEMINGARDSKLDLHEYIIKREMETSQKDREFVINRLKHSMDVMKKSLEDSIKIDVFLPIDVAMEQSQKMLATPYFLSKEIKEAVYWAMSINEYNAGMGLICAAPTAGSCGVFPATLLKAKEMLNKSEDDLLHAIIVGAAIGVIIGNRATLSGSEGGCQAEIGSASAMSAAAITYMISHSNLDLLKEAVALALKNMLGLVCDPVAGLVISPCIKRNAIGTVNAFLAAEMALSGVTSVIPADEVIDAMKDVGQMMPTELKETSLGGLATTPMGKKIKATLQKKEI